MLELGSESAVVGTGHWSEGWPSWLDAGRPGAVGGTFDLLAGVCGRCGR